MEDMIASVRTILEAEERKEREQTKRISPAPRPEPQSKGNGSAFKSGERPVEAAARLEPRIGPSPKRLSQDGASSGFAEPPAPAFDLEKTPKPEKRAAPPRPAPRGRAGNLALAKILEKIPRTARVGSPQTVQISLSREEAGLIFGRFARRGPQPSAAAEAGCRAITVRLTAPEGLLLIETLTPETQWLLDRPGEEPFGTWAWTAIPSDSGSLLPQSFDVGPRGGRERPRKRGHFAGSDDEGARASQLLARIWKLRADRLLAVDGGRAGGNGLLRLQNRRQAPLSARGAEPQPLGRATLALDRMRFLWLYRMQFGGKLCLKIKNSTLGRGRQCVPGRMRGWMRGIRPISKSSLHSKKIGEGAAFCRGRQVNTCKARSLGYRSGAQ